jgi:MFS family permease
LGLVYLQKIAGRRTLFLISLSTLTILNLGLAVSMIFSHVLASIFIMCIYMAVYGASYIAPVWSYPTEIVPAKQSTIPNIVQWLSLAISTLVPPLITGSMPNSNPYPIFIFYGIYTFIGFIHVFKMLKEPDGKSYYEIIQSFK